MHALWVLLVFVGTLLLSGQSLLAAARGTELALQGICATTQNADPRRPDDRGVSTVSCPGESQSPLEFNYPDGVAEACLYIDNMTGRDGRSERSFFVPLKTSEEWSKFKQSVASGALRSSVALSYGCRSKTVSGPCGGVATLRAGRNGSSQTVSLTAQMSATYTCSAVSGCGTWKLTSGGAGSCSPALTCTATMWSYLYSDACSQACTQVNHGVDNCGVAYTTVDSCNDGRCAAAPVTGDQPPSCGGYGSCAIGIIGGTTVIGSGPGQYMMYWYCLNNAQTASCQYGPY